MITLVSNPHHPTPALRYGTQYMKKFRLSEKHTKFEKKMVLINQLIYLVNVKNMRKLFSNSLSFSKSLNFKLYNIDFVRNSIYSITYWYIILQSDHGSVSETVHTVILPDGTLKKWGLSTGCLITNPAK